MRCFKILAAALALAAGMAVCVNAAESMAVVSLAQAKKAAAAAQAYARVKGWTMAVAVVNNEGSLVYFERADNTQIGSTDAAIDKAKSANAFRRPTRAFADNVKQGRLGVLTLKGVVAIEGGLPIVVNGVHLGGIGVSGAHASEDEECSAAGLEALK